MDSDDDLPYIEIPGRKNDDSTFAAVKTKVLSIACSDAANAESAVLLGNVDENTVVVDSDSSEDNDWDLREQCNSDPIVPLSSDSVSACTELSNLLWKSVDSGKLSVDSEEDLSFTDDCPTMWPSREDSQEVSSQQLSERTASDMSSQASSVLPEISKRRKRPAKVEDPDVVARKIARQQEKEKRQREKLEQKLQREETKKQRELAKQEMIFEKTKKRLMQESVRSTKPGECMKNSGIRYEVADQVLPYTISFSREHAIVQESDTKKLETKYEECIENEILLYLPLMEFLQLVDGFQKEKEGLTLSSCGSSSLTKFVQTKKCYLAGRNLTVLVQGIDAYFRQQKTEARQAYRSKVMAAEQDAQSSGSVPKQKKRMKDDCISVSMLTVEEALLQLQLDTGTCVKLLETDVELAKTVFQYTKAVAERPFKQNRMQMSAFSMFVEGGRGTRVGTDGSGLTNVWRQQLMQFKNVSVEVSNAIVAQYPLPRLLYNAYKSCKSEKEAETLLENILVRRGAGVMATVRRVGKEFSRRLYTMMTSTDPQLVLQ